MIIYIVKNDEARQNDPLLSSHLKESLNASITFLIASFIHGILTIVLIGSVIKERVENIEFGRIAAQAAKQVIVQKVREAERAQVVEKYRSVLGELVNGTVKKVTREFLIIDLGDGAEAILSRNELIPGEVFRIGDRLRAVLQEEEREIHYYIYYKA